MSEVRASAGRKRRRRADAERSIEAVLDAAIRVLGQRPDASLEDVAAAAGVTRQTIYAHFPSRHALIDAVVDRVTDEAVAAMDAADLDSRPPAAALVALLEAGWRTLERFPLLLHVTPEPTTAEADRERHEPILERLERLVRRGQATGDFDPDASPGWLIAAAIALSHTAGEEVAAGRLTADDAVDELRRSVLRVFGVDTPPPPA